ncbi:dTMP kinase [Candidatus Caldatribacterium saccharofermentans]|uniref:Thymidylate kinase n=1 Tax=Candidatus Caldatribacterium saccharofermentans TaxID=1454753 RepID=A0A7V4TIQ3_9BACT
MGFFLTFEGIEGSGKTTQAQRLFEFLQSKGLPCVLTREPGGTPFGEALRMLLLRPETGSLDPLTEALLFAAARREHVLRVLAPALSAGKVVLCVRFTDSTLAYQGWGRGVDFSFLRLLNEQASGGLTPHCTVLLDVEPETGLSRSLASHDPREVRFELEFAQETHLLERIREGYLELARREPERFIVIPVNRSEEEVFQEIVERVLPRIRQWKEGEV